VTARRTRTSLLIDKAYLFFDRVRARAIPRLVSDAVIDAYNDLAYGETQAYRADCSTFRRGLFGWEEQATRCFFPPAPARVLIGGADGGREAFALGGMGYEVVASEPSVRLATTMLEGTPEGMNIRAFRARYEELPMLRSLRAGTADEDLGRLAPFDAAIDVRSLGGKPGVSRIGRGSDDCVAAGDFARPSAGWRRGRDVNGNSGDDREQRGVGGNLQAELDE